MTGVKLKSSISCQNLQNWSQILLLNFTGESSKNYKIGEDFTKYKKAENHTSAEDQVAYELLTFTSDLETNETQF